MKTFLRRMTVAIVTWLVGHGLPIPEIALSRLPEYARLKKVLDRQEINCLLDVGANRGQFALIARRLGYDGVIHSFEPQQESFRALEKRSKGDPDWHCHNFALGQSEGKAALRANQKHSEMSSLYPIDDEYGGISQQIVHIKPLDSIFADLVEGIGYPRVFLKTDTEGHDLAVIRGAKSSMAYVQVLQAEVFVRPIYEGAPHYLEVLAEIEAAGFAMEHLAVVSVTNQDRLMCLNALFVRSD